MCCLHKRFAFSAVFEDVRNDFTIRVKKIVIQSLIVKISINENKLTCYQQV